jgi:tetratricopeptide (TPR) repeat protein
LRIAVSAYLALDSVDAALHIIDLFDESSYMNVKRKIQIYTKADDSRSLRLLIENAIRNNISRSNSMWSKAAWQYKLIGNDTGVEEALKSALAPNIENSEYTKMEAYYLLGDYDKINKNIDSWLKAYPENHYILSYAARVRAHQGDENAIAEMIEILDMANANDQYDYGFYTYYKGVIAAIQGDEENAINLLEQAYQEGHEFLDIYYQNDIDLMPLFDNPRFDSLIHPTVK